jgi:hypothetical protein
MLIKSRAGIGRILAKLLFSMSPQGLLEAMRSVLITACQ